MFRRQTSEGRETGGSPLRVVAHCTHAGATRTRVSASAEPSAASSDRSGSGVGPETRAPLHPPEAPRLPAPSTTTDAERLVATTSTVSSAPLLEPTATVLPAVSTQAPVRAQLPLRHRLPNPPPGFVGRESEQAFLRAAFTRSPIAVVCGPGGLGKTALVLKTLPLLDGFDQERTLWIELRPGPPAEDPQLLLIRILAHAQGLERLDWSEIMRDAETVGGTLVDLAESGGWWIVLDDFHHVLPPAANALTSLLVRYARRSRWIITSQEVPTMVELRPQELPLTGLPEDALRQLATSFAPSLPETALLDALKASGGSPWILQQLLTTPADALRDDPMLGGLPAHARSFLETLAAVDNAFPLDALSALTPIPVHDMLSLLQRRGLIQYSYGGYRLHDVVRRMLLADQANGHPLPSPVVAARQLCLQHDADALLEGARILMNAGEIDDVQRMLQQHIDFLIDEGCVPRLWHLLEFSKEPRLYRWQLQCAVLMGQPSRLATLAPPGNDADVSLQLFWARALLLQSKTGEALEAAQRTLETAQRQNSTPTLLFEAGVLLVHCLGQLHRFDAVWTVLETLEPPDADARMMRDAWTANCLARSGRFAEAVERVDSLKLAELSPKSRYHNDILYHISTVLSLDGQAEKGYEISKRIVSSQLPREALLCTHIVLAFDRGCYEDAGNSLARLKSFRRDPSRPSHFESVATLHYHLVTGDLESVPAEIDALKREIPPGHSSRCAVLCLEAGHRTFRAEPPFELRDELTDASLSEATEQSHLMLRLSEMRWRARAGQPLPSTFAAPGSPEATLASVKCYPAVIRQIRAEAALAKGAPLEALEHCLLALQCTQQIGEGGTEVELRQLHCDILMALEQWDALAPAATSLNVFAAGMPSARYQHEARFFMAFLPFPSISWETLEGLANLWDVAPIASRRARVLLEQNSPLDAVDRRVLAVLKGPGWNAQRARRPITGG